MGMSNLCKKNFLLYNRMSKIITEIEMQTLDFH